MGAGRARLTSRGQARTTQTLHLVLCIAKDGLRVAARVNLLQRLLEFAELVQRAARDGPLERPGVVPGDMLAHKRAREARRPEYDQIDVAAHRFCDPGEGRFSRRTRPICHGLWHLHGSERSFPANKRIVTDPRALGCPAHHTHRSWWIPPSWRACRISRDAESLMRLLAC